MQYLEDCSELAVSGGRVADGPALQWGSPGFGCGRQGVAWLLRFDDVRVDPLVAAILGWAGLEGSLTGRWRKRRYGTCVLYGFQLGRLPSAPVCATMLL
jgi:hypothetical protein